MINLLQLEQLSRIYKINTSVIAREYLQLVFLQQLYELKGSENIIFKGGTAIHFLSDGFRFSEDLDFTVTVKNEIGRLIDQVVEKSQLIIHNLKLKEKKTIAGKSYLLTMEKGVIPFAVFVSLDFSFREKVLQPQQNIIKTSFPIIFNTFIHHMGAEEIIAEKIRAILTRNKGRDLFDLWYLLNKGYALNKKFVKEKMKYYPQIVFSWDKVTDEVKKFTWEQFKTDLTPFLSLDKRGKLNETFAIIKTQLVERLKNQ